MIDCPACSFRQRIIAVAIELHAARVIGGAGRRKFKGLRGTIQNCARIQQISTGESNPTLLSAKQAKRKIAVSRDWRKEQWCLECKRSNAEHGSIVLYDAHMPSAFRQGLLLLGVITPLLGGCSNEFISSYQGDRFPATESVQVVAAQPQGSGLIGVSSFSAGAGFGEPEAIAAACAVGATSVQWGKGFDNGRRPAGEGTVSSSLTPMPPTSSWSPAQPGGQLYRYVARFYRAGVPNSPNAMPIADVPQNGDASQVIEDSTAATKEASGR